MRWIHSQPALSGWDLVDWDSINPVGLRAMHEKDLDFAWGWELLAGGGRVIGDIPIYRHRPKKAAVLARYSAAMSEENLQIVRKIWDAWAQGDFSAVGWADPEILFIGAGSTVPEETRGAEEMGRSWADWLRSMSDFRTEAVEFFHQGDQVVVFNQFSGSGRVSGLPLDDWLGAVRFEMRDEKVVVLQLYTDRKQALREAGIEG